LVYQQLNLPNSLGERGHADHRGNELQDHPDASMADGSISICRSAPGGFSCVS
jgi:hypothetical protein